MMDASTSISPFFWHQPAAERTLHAANDRGRLAHSYLLTGPSGVGKWAAAQWVAQVLFCRADAPDACPCGTCENCVRVAKHTHPDCHTLFPVPKAKAEQDTQAFLEAKAGDPFAVVTFEKKPNLAIDRIRALITELSKTAVEGGPKVAIIASADQMIGDVQAILLKSIEEPPPETYFVLTSSDPGRILPTVISRCQVIRFAPVDPARISDRLKEESLTDDADADVVAQLCGGGWGMAVQLAREDARAWRTEMTKFWNSAFRLRPGEMLTEIEKYFRSRRYDQVTQAFDLWSLLLRKDCEMAVSGTEPAGAPIPDASTGWACWRVLDNGRSTLRVNVLARNAVRGTFLSLRRQLRRERAGA